MHKRATKHFQYSLLDTQKKEKKIKLFTRESSQQAKEEREIFLGFIFNYYSKEINYYYFFLFFLKFIKHTRRKQEKENKLAWIIQ